MSLNNIPNLRPPCSFTPMKSHSPPSPPSSTSSSPTTSPCLKVKKMSNKPYKSSQKEALHAPDLNYSVKFHIHSVPSNINPPEEQIPLIPQDPHKDIVMKKYSTSVDKRGFLTVYEYKINEQWIIWDYHTGYVHLTGLWKAIGNNKADIVKLVQASPDIEEDIKRVRGGYLKIQGTWVPFEIAQKLAARTCYHIRFALIPLFGESFPSMCLTPQQPGFGQLQLTDPEESTKRRRRKRRVESINNNHNNNNSNNNNNNSIQPNQASPPFETPLTPTASPYNQTRPTVVSPPDFNAHQNKRRRTNPPVSSDLPRPHGQFLAPALPYHHHSIPTYDHDHVLSTPRIGLNTEIFDRLHNNDKPQQQHQQHDFSSIRLPPIQNNYSYDSNYNYNRAGRRSFPTLEPQPIPSSPSLSSPNYTTTARLSVDSNASNIATNGSFYKSPSLPLPSAFSSSSSSSSYNTQTPAIGPADIEAAGSLRELQASNFHRSNSESTNDEPRRKSVMRIQDLLC